MILEFVIVGNIKGYLWKPVNQRAKLMCELMHRKNLTVQQITLCKALGFTIKAEREDHEDETTSYKRRAVIR